MSEEDINLKFAKRVPPISRSRKIRGLILIAIALAFFGLAMLFWYAGERPN
jgi:hypothetical protein